MAVGDRHLGQVLKCALRRKVNDGIFKVDELLILFEMRIITGEESIGNATYFMQHLSQMLFMHLWYGVDAVSMDHGIEMVPFHSCLTR